MLGQKIFGNKINDWEILPPSVLLDAADTDNL